MQRRGFLQTTLAAAASLFAGVLPVAAARLADNPAKRATWYGPHGAGKSYCGPVVKLRYKNASMLRWIEADQTATLTLGGHWVIDE